MGRLLFLAENDQISNVNDGDDFESISTVIKMAIDH